MLHNAQYTIYIFLDGMSLYIGLLAIIHVLLSMLYAIYIIQYMVCIVKHQVILNMQFYAAQSWKALLSWCISNVHK